uniref:Protein kinase domain-containing protein n=1 Tax=Hanusia phi TaxID=3032 RepID=A0A7S0E259_9CRYP|mmetsp:Transcript_15069/g.34650  ORF Transcript_15069/g.34650 Transcript_15069/m.34650 type:complete len:1013 (+) Transcript_15069:261-3299(+)
MGKESQIIEAFYPSLGSCYKKEKRLKSNSSWIQVWWAQETTSKRDVALKIIDLENNSKPDALDILQKEIAIMRKCSHKNIIHLLATFCYGSELWLVVDFMNRGSCGDQLRARYHDGFSQEVVSFILQQAIEGIAYLHGEDLLHRDIKADNLLIDSCGHVRISAAEFRMSQEAQRNMRRTFVGTPSWLAPEVVEQESGYDFKADIWALGITVFELSTGSTPFSGMKPLKVLKCILQAPPPRLDDRFPPSVRDLVSSCLQADPADRATASTLKSHSYFHIAKAPSEGYFTDVINENSSMDTNQSSSEVSQQIEDLEWTFDEVERLNIMSDHELDRSVEELYFQTEHSESSTRVSEQSLLPSICDLLGDTTEDAEKAQIPSYTNSAGPSISFFESPELENESKASPGHGGLNDEGCNPSIKRPADVPTASMKTESVTLEQTNLKSESKAVTEVFAREICIVPCDCIDNLTMDGNGLQLEDAQISVDLHTPRSRSGSLCLELLSAQGSPMPTGSAPKDESSDFRAPPSPERRIASVTFQVKRTSMSPALMRSANAQLSPCLYAMDKQIQGNGEVGTDTGMEQGLDAVDSSGQTMRLVVADDNVWAELEKLLSEPLSPRSPMRLSNARESDVPPEFSLDGEFSIGNKAEVEVPKAARCFTLVPNEGSNEGLYKLTSESDEGLRVSVTVQNVENADSANPNSSSQENVSAKSLRIRTHSLQDTHECVSNTKDGTEQGQTPCEREKGKSHGKKRFLIVDVQEDRNKDSSANSTSSTSSQPGSSQSLPETLHHVEADNAKLVAPEASHASISESVPSQAKIVSHVTSDLSGLEQYSCSTKGPSGRSLTQPNSPMACSWAQAGTFRSSSATLRESSTAAQSDGRGEGTTSSQVARPPAEEGITRILSAPLDSPKSPRGRFSQDRQLERKHKKFTFKDAPNAELPVAACGHPRGPGQECQQCRMVQDAENCNPADLTAEELREVVRILKTRVKQLSDEKSKLECEKSELRCNDWNWTREKVR